jgi:hypothetical protein
MGDPLILESVEDVETPSRERFAAAEVAKEVILGVGVGASRFLARTVPGVLETVLGAGVRDCRAGVADEPPLERWE